MKLRLNPFLEPTSTKLTEFVLLKETRDPYTLSYNYTMNNPGLIRLGCPSLTVKGAVLHTGLGISLVICQSWV